MTTPWCAKARANAWSAKRTSRWWARRRTERRRSDWRSELKPNVALIDIAMPNLNGIEATKQIKANQPATSILVLSAYDNDQYIYAVLEAGANGYLLKNVRGAQLVDAIRDVSAGEVVLDPHVARKVVQWFSSMSHGKSVVEGLPDHFSERELEVLRLAAKGMSNKEIASELALSVRTVQSHLGNIFDKLGVSSRTEAVLRALKEGWISLDNVSADDVAEMTNVTLPGRERCSARRRAENALLAACSGSRTSG